MTSTYGRATIPAGQSLSNAVDLGDGTTRVGLIIPSVWETAAITFQAAVVVSSGGISRFGNLYDDTGIEVTIAAANVVAGRAIAIASLMSANDLLPWRYIKIRSGTLGAPVTQTAERIIDVVAES